MQSEIGILQDLLAVGSAGGKQHDADAGGGIDQLAIEQIGTADLIDEPKRQRRRRLRLRLADLDDRELVASQPGDDIVAPGGGANPFADHGQQPVAGVAPERFVDGLEAVEIDGQNRHGFGSGLRIGEQSGQLLVEHEPVAELGQGVDTRLGQPFGHVVGADQPAAFHRDGLDPERTTARQVDLAIALAVVAAGLRVDQIEQIGSRRTACRTSNWRAAICRPARRWQPPGTCW